MILSTPAFIPDAAIPSKFTCDGGDINPEFQIGNVPPEAKSLAIIVDDPDAPGGTFTHWIVWNISPRTTVIKQESKPPGSIEGKNSAGKTGYMGPCPPPGKPHHYHFKLFALDSMSDLPPEAGRGQLEAEIRSHLLAEARLVGVYGR